MTAEGNNDCYKKSNKFNDAFVDANTAVEEVTCWDKDNENETGDAENDDNFSDEEIPDIVANSKMLVKFRNAAFTWGMKDDILLEIEDLEIPSGNVYV